MIYINKLADELSCNAKLFADGTSLLFVMHDVDSAAAELNNDLAKISPKVRKWKMSFNPGPSKQCQEVIFGRKVNKDSHPPLTFTEVLKI